jgi:hypothetical protein
LEGKRIVEGEPLKGKIAAGKMPKGKGTIAEGKMLKRG